MNHEHEILHVSIIIGRISRPPWDMWRSVLAFAAVLVCAQTGEAFGVVPTISRVGCWSAAAARPPLSLRRVPLKVPAQLSIFPLGSVFSVSVADPDVLQHT
jgi:hypothetical protein